MKAKWLLEEDMFWDENPDVLTPAIKELGMEVKSVKYRPFDDAPYRDFYDPEECVISYGSLNFITKLKREKPWVPGAWCNLKNMLCSTYYAYYGVYLLNRAYIFVPLAELLNRPDSFFNRFEGNNNDYIFLRPDSGNKDFTGGVFEKTGLEKQLKGMSYGTLDPTCMVVAASVKGIEAEYRFFVADGEVVSGCTYKVYEKGQLIHSEREGYPLEAKLLAEQIAREEWQPDPMYVVDIAKAGNGDYYLLEINSFSSAGIYACDPIAIVKKASELAIKEWTEINEI